MRPLLALVGAAVIAPALADDSLSEQLYQAQALQARGRYASAEQIFRRVLLTVQAQGPRSVDTAIALDNLANELFETSQYMEARALFEHAVSIIEERLGVQNPVYATIAAHLAVTYEKFGQYSRAEALLLKSLEIVRKTGSEDFLIADIKHELATIAFLEGRYPAAAEQFRAALEAFQTMDSVLFRQRFETREERVATTLSDLASAIAQSGKLGEAIAEGEQAKAIMDHASNPPPRSEVKVLTTLASLYAIAGRAREAESLAKRSLSLAEASCGPQDLTTASVLDEFAMVERRLNRKHRAEALEKRANLIRANTGDGKYSALTVSVQSLLPPSNKPK
jgi:tetratricopeptide (TPR) repeat protein